MSVFFITLLRGVVLLPRIKIWLKSVVFIKLNSQYYAVFYDADKQGLIFIELVETYPPQVMYIQARVFFDVCAYVRTQRPFGHMEAMYLCAAHRLNLLHTYLKGEAYNGGTQRNRQRHQLNLVVVTDRTT
jgi:hypothetical protein